MLIKYVPTIINTMGSESSAPTDYFRSGDFTCCKGICIPVLQHKKINSSRIIILFAH